MRLLFSWCCRRVKDCQGFSNRSRGMKMVAIDLRSDTLTKPTLAMRKAMAEAVVGDDVRNEDPTVNELEKRCAELFGMEASLFVPSGTMGNLISIMTHCDSRLSELIVGSNHHIQLYEQGGYAQIAGVACNQIIPESDGTLKFDRIEAVIRPDELHQPSTRLLCLENTHMHCGGRILPLDYHEKVRKLTSKHGVKVHLDGARLMNACVGLGVTPDVILKNVDSVSMCFSKGLGCPVGSIIGGNREFIKRAIRIRKALGGGMRQAGVLAAAALYVLDSPYEKMIQCDHKNAKKLAEGISALGCDNLRVDVANVQTNFVVVETGSVDAQKVVKLLSQDDGSLVSVRTGTLTGSALRLVTHRDINEDDIDKVIEKFEKISHLLH